MTPHTQPRRKHNSSKVNLLISFIFHASLVVALFYFAARQGFLGKKLQKISVEMVKEKPPPKPKPQVKPPVLPREVATPKPVVAPKPVAEARTAPPPAVEAPTVAPPAATLPGFNFAGGQSVISSSDPVELYKSALEFAIRSKWDRPQNLDDSKYVAEVQVNVGRNGQISDPVWEKRSGNPVWDHSVSAAIAAVTGLDRPPPTNFPSRVTLRFDVQEETGTLLQ